MVSTDQQLYSKIDLLVKLDSNNIGVTQDECREKHFEKVLTTIDNGKTLFDCNSEDLQNCIEVITNNGKPDMGIKINDPRITKLQAITIFPFINYIFKNREKIKKELKKRSLESETKYNLALAKEQKLNYDTKSINIEKVYHKITHKGNSDINLKSIKFILDISHLLYADYSETTKLEKQFIIAVAKSARYKQTMVDRNTSIVTFETPSKSFGEWIYLARREVIPSRVLMKEILEKILT